MKNNRIAVRLEDDVFEAVEAYTAKLKTLLPNVTIDRSTAVRQLLILGLQEVGCLKKAKLSE